MKINLLLNALLKCLLGFAAMLLLLFWPAGTLAYANGWLFVCLMFIPMLLTGLYLWLKCPELLEKRLHTQESEPEQKTVILWSALMFIASFLLAGFDHRFGWTRVPRVVVIIAAVIFVVAYGLYIEVMRENAYLSRTVEVQEGQKVIDTGLYGLVRHPMYFSVLLLFIAMPLVLGSWISLLAMLPLPLALAKRIKNEEAVLRKGLTGYTDYCQRVKYRMLPFVW